MNNGTIIGLTIVAAILLIVGIGYYIVKWRKKKTLFKTKKAEDKDKLDQKFNYRVTIADKFSGTFREVATFGVEKIRSAENILTLSNAKMRFDEFFPYDDEDTDYTIEFVEKKLELAKKAIKDNDKDNPYNLKSEVIKWDKILHSLKTKGGEFWKVDKDGVSHALFVRHGSVNIPWKWNSETMQIQPPSDPFIKDVISSREDKHKKYLAKNLMWKEIIVTIGLFVMLVMSIGNGVWSYANAKFDDTDIARMQERIDNAPLLCAEYLGTASENFVLASQNSVQASKNAVNITNAAASWVNKPISRTIPVINVE